MWASSRHTKSPRRSTRSVQLYRKYPNIQSRLGTPVNIIPRHDTAFAKSSGSSSIVIATSPSTDMLKPVAVMMTSASSVSPEASVMPCSVNDSIWSVTTEAWPDLIDWKKSPSGTKAMRCCHGSVGRVEVPVDVEVLAQQLSDGPQQLLAQRARGCRGPSWTASLAAGSSGAGTISWIHSSGISRARSMVAVSF